MYFKGGFTDFVYHKTQQDGTTEEILPPSGGPWGGIFVDENFSNFLNEICGQQIMEIFKSKEVEDYIDLFAEFESKKRSVQPDVHSNIILTLPVSLVDFVNGRHGRFDIAIATSPYKDIVKYRRQRLHIPQNTFKSLFHPTIAPIIQYMTTIRNNSKDLDKTILIMVGGFSKCELVQEAVRKCFGKTVSLVIPEEPEIAVMKGAVLFGFQQAVSIC